MNGKRSNSHHFNSDAGKQMTFEELAQVVDAIRAGRYSWACMLALKFAGYNPSLYIPYRTYQRLNKENSKAME